MHERHFTMLSAMLLSCAITVAASAAPADTASMTGVRPGSALGDSLAAHLTRPDTAAAALIEHSVPAPAETAAVTPPTPALLWLGGNRIFRVRVGRDGLDPTARAAAIRSRLNQAVADQRVSADAVRLIPGPDGIQVRLGPHFLWLITPGDVSGRDQAELAAELAELPMAIRDGIERERAGRRPARVLISAAIALALTLLALGVFRLLLVGSRRWRRWLTRTVATQVPAIRLRDFEVLSKAQVGAAATGVLARVDVVLGILLLYGYVASVFSLFPWTQGWSALLVGFALG